MNDRPPPPPLETRHTHHQPELTDNDVAKKAEYVAIWMCSALSQLDWTVHEPHPSGNEPGAWTITAEASGLSLHIEITPSPWEDDGTWEATR